MKRNRYRGIYYGPGYRKSKFIDICFSIWEGRFILSQNKR